MAAAAAAGGRLNCARGGDEGTGGFLDGQDLALLGAEGLSLGGGPGVEVALELGHHLAELSSVGSTLRGGRCKTVRRIPPDVALPKARAEGYVKA